MHTYMIYNFEWSVHQCREQMCFQIYYGPCQHSVSTHIMVEGKEVVISVRLAVCMCVCTCRGVHTLVFMYVCASGDICECVCVCVGVWGGDDLCWCVNE